MRLLALGHPAVLIRHIDKLLVGGFRPVGGGRVNTVARRQSGLGQRGVVGVHGSAQSRVGRGRADGPEKEPTDNQN
jgi:hypothetical protein